MNFVPNCDMLIDQNKFIGSDPIGHVCYNKATMSDGTYYICDECLDRLADPEDNSITVPPVGGVKMFELMVEEINK